MKKRKTIVLVGAIVAAGAFFAFSPAANPMAKPINSPRLRKSKYARYTRFIEAMAKHESANYTSDLAKQYNNIFGMGFPRIRKAVNEGPTERRFEGVYKSAYKNYDQAIQDLILWFDFNNFPTDLDGLGEFVKGLQSKGYFTDTFFNYYNGLARYA